jgi:hypothetical protein
VAKANIVVTDGYTLNPGDNPWDTVAALGELTVYERSAANEVVNRCREADILVVNKTPIREAALGQSAFKRQKHCHHPPSGLGHAGGTQSFDGIHRWKYQCVP